MPFIIQWNDKKVSSLQALQPRAAFRLAGDGIDGQNNFGGPMATTGYMAGTITVT